MVHLHFGRWNEASATSAVIFANSVIDDFLWRKDLLIDGVVASWTCNAIFSRLQKLELDYCIRLIRFEARVRNITKMIYFTHIFRRTHMRESFQYTIIFLSFSKGIGLKLFKRDIKQTQSSSLQIQAIAIEPSVRIFSLCDYMSHTDDVGNSHTRWEVGSGLVEKEAKLVLGPSAPPAWCHHIARRIWSCPITKWPTSTAFVAATTLDKAA